MKTSERERYSRQILFPGIGEAGQEKLLAARVAIVGCGALGSQQASMLARAGIGELVVIDRDYVEESNLQRQTLFSESDAVERLPKAVAAEHHLRAANPNILVRGVVADLTGENADLLLRGAQVILDGTDNFTTRYLLNDYCVATGMPWVYGAAVGSRGVSMTVVPGRTPCLACLFPSAPAGLHETCDTAGILGSAAAIVASIQVTETFKLLVGDEGSLSRRLVSFDLWRNAFQAIETGEPDPGCRVCAKREFTYLNARRELATTLCGRGSVQVSGRREPVDFAELEARLRPLGTVRGNPYLLRFAVEPYELTIFPDGRAIIKGTEDAGVARSLYARYIGV